MISTAARVQRIGIFAMLRQNPKAPLMFLLAAPDARGVYLFLHLELDNSGTPPDIKDARLLPLPDKAV